ncbi:MAG: iron transporter permease [Bacillales bacterium]|jgi:iron complex transport system permease protein|nr:iron transporter permease [Bacillales bacterium]
MNVIISKKLHITFLLCSLLFITILVNMNLGSIKLSPYEVIQTIFGFGTDQSRLILFEFRLPRIILAILIGAGLAVSGVILQSISENDLAEPGIIGINAGAGFGVILFIFFKKGNTFDALSFIEAMSIPVAAIIGGLFAAAITFLIASRNGLTPIKLILVGVAVNAALQSVILFVQMRMNDSELTSAIVWLAGSIWVSNWDYVLSVIPWLAILIPFVMYNAKTLDIIQLGENNAIGLGVALQLQRKLFILVAVILAGVAVSVGGGIAFVGLIAPHMARRLVGSSHNILIPVSLLIGSILVLFADTIGKNLLENSEIPVGLLIAIIGAPYFIYLLMRTK